MAAGLARLIEETGWDLSVELDKEAPRGEFAVYLDDERVFSRLEWHPSRHDPYLHPFACRLP